MEDITTTLRQGAEQVLDERQKKAQQYTFLNEALFKIKNPEYTSPYENIGQKTTRLFNKQEIQDIYDTLNPMYQSLADYGNPNDEQKKEMAAVKLASVFGTDYESAKKLTNIYYPMYAERDLREKGYGTRLWNAIESSFYNDMIGYNSTIATLFGSEEAKKRADDYYEKMMKVRNWQDFGAVGNFFIDNMQGIYSMGKMALITALTSGMGTALGASTKALSIVSGAINTIDSGATQMGSNVYMMSKMTDDNGNPLFDFENITPSERVLFGISAGLMGAIETVEFETLGKVLPKSIRNSIATAKATKLMNEAFLKTITVNGAKTTALEFAKNVGSNVLGEGLEEVLQQYVGNAFEVIEADIQNSRGANFGKDYSFDKHINEGIWESFWGGLEGSVLASLLSVGTGTFLNNKAIAQAQKKLGNYQTKTETSHTTYNDFIKNTDDFNFTQEEIIKRAEDIKQGKAEPIKTYKAENFGLYTDSDGALFLKARQTIDPSLNIVEAEIVESEVHDISTEAKKGRFATQFGGGLYKEDPNSFYFDNAEDLESAKQKIKNIKGLKLNDNILTVDTPNGEQTFNLKTIDEIEQARTKEREQAQQEYLEEEINPQLRKYMSFTDEEFKKVDNYIKENNISKNEKETEALKSFLGQIYRITKKGKNASVDNFLNSINIITEDNANLKASIDITTEANENGYRQATIHLTKDSTFASITHELNHYLQNNADIEDLRGFEEAYNIDLSNREVWNEQVSDELKEKRKIKNKDYTYAELFANDATKYYTQGTAENKEMANFFSKMKKALKKLVDFAIAKFLNKKTIRAFDKLFNNSKEYTQTENNNIINKANSNGVITYYETNEEIDKTKSKYNNKKEEKYGQQGYQPTDEFRRIQERTRALSKDAIQQFHRYGFSKNEDVQRECSSIFKRELDTIRAKCSNVNEFTLNENKYNNNFIILNNIPRDFFHDIFEIAKSYLKNGELVDLHEDYSNTKCYLTEDGMQGFAIEENGNLVSVFNLDTNKKGFLSSIKDFIKEQGATHLDCYNSDLQPLNKIYIKTLGFKSASIMDYNMEYDHDDIAKNHNSPQVAFMVNTAEEVETKHFNKDQYDEAQAWQLHYINKDNKNIYYETEENPNNFIHTKEDIENIKNKDWILPPREEIKELDEDTAFIYNTIDLQKANGLDLINEARKIREDYELTQEGESDINGILTDEELQEINRANEERIANGFEADVEHELFKIFKNRMLDKVDNLPNNFNEVLDYAWKLADIKTEAEEDTEFVYKYATDYDGLLTLIKVLNKANKIIDKGRMIHLYNEYQGVADDILQLRRNSPKAKLKEALATIQSDPRSYRIAFEDASDLLYKGVDDALGKRDYYRTIKSELLDYLGKKEEEASEDLTEEEIETKANENLSNLRNIANLKGIPNDLKEPLKRSQARLKQLQHELEKANKKDKKTIDRLQEEIKDQEAKTEKLRQKIADYLTSQQIGKELKKAIKLSNFSDKTHSLKGASEFYWVKLKFLDEEGTNGYNTDLSNLARVNKIFSTDINLNEPSELMKYLLKRNNLEKEELETLQDFKNLNSLLRDLRRLARLQFKADENKRRNSIFELRKRAYNEAYGKNGTQSKGEDFTMSFFDKGAVNELNKKINSIESIEEKEDFLTKVRKETDKLFLATAHPAQIARYIDKTTNGTWQAIIENLNRSEEALQSSKNERYRNIQKSIENLMGFEAKHLLHDKGKEEAYLAQKTNEKGEKFIVKLNNGAIKELTRNEALMIYGYAIQDKGMACLTSEIGNNFTKDSVINLCNNLISDRDKQLVNLLSQDLSSKDLTIARIYARQNNKIYDTLENYFPLYASQGSFQSLGADSSGVGLRTTLHNDSNYVNKNFTKERTSVVYALKLDLWNNYIKGVERQEKYIYQSDWVRDAQNWISPRGMGTFLTREKGQLWTTTIKNLINDIAEPQRKVNELNGFMSRAFSNIVTANLMFNTVSAIKQVGAWFAVFTDPDFNLFSFAKAIADLTFRHKETVNNILQSNPDIDLQKGKGLDINESFEKNQEKRALGTFKEWGLKMADFMDLQGRYVVWQSAYQSYIDKHGITDNKGKLDISKNFEAIRKANRIVEETQNSTKRSQLASIQTKVSFLGSDKLAYSNSTFQYLNKFYDAIHLAKNKDYKGVLGHLSLLLFNGAFMTLLSGVLFRPSEKDKEKEDKRKKQMVKDLLSDFFEGFIPGWNELSPFFGGYQYNNSSVYSIADLPRKIIKVVEDCRDKEETKKVIADVMSASAEISKPLFSTPQIMVDRLAKGINDKDSTTLDKATINVLINLILGTGFYNNIKGR